MVKNIYRARSKDITLIDRVNSELSQEALSGGRLCSYKAYGKFWQLIFMAPQPSWSGEHIHTEEPLQYDSYSISLVSRPIKKWRIVGSSIGTEVTMEVEGENFEDKISSLIEKYNFEEIK